MSTEGAGGKAPRGRRHRAGPGNSAPYGRRPPPKPRSAEEEEEALPGAPPAPPPGLLTSAFRFGASLITKVSGGGHHPAGIPVAPPEGCLCRALPFESLPASLQVPVLGSYFAGGAGASPAAAAAAPPSPTTSAGDEAVVNASEDTAPADGLDEQIGAREEQQQQQQEPAHAARPAARRVAFQSPAAEPEDGDAATPEQHRPAVDQGSDGAATPYDDVLAMLRQGPLAAQSPRSFPRPRAGSLLIAGAGRTPGPALAPSASPSPAAADPGSRRLGAPGLRLSLTTATAGGGTPASGLRLPSAARSTSRFSRTPVHMQPLAAGGPGGAAGTSRFGLAAAAAASGDGGAAGGLSPAPLAWTPMRSNLAAGGRGGPVSGAKRKADSASPAAGEQRLLARARSRCARAQPACTVDSRLSRWLWLTASLHSASGGPNMRAQPTLNPTNCRGGPVGEHQFAGRAAPHPAAR